VEAIFYLAVAVVLAVWAYKSGKRTGSVKGFGAGRAFRRHRR
jgi:hypothetical protein